MGSLPLLGFDQGDLKPFFLFTTDSPHLDGVTNFMGLQSTEIIVIAVHRFPVDMGDDIAKRNFPTRIPVGAGHACLGGG